MFWKLITLPQFDSDSPLTVEYDLNLPALKLAFGACFFYDYDG